MCQPESKSFATVLITADVKVRTVCQHGLRGHGRDPNSGERGRHSMAQIRASDFFEDRMRMTVLVLLSRDHPVAIPTGSDSRRSRRRPPIVAAGGFARR